MSFRILVKYEAKNELRRSETEKNVVMSVKFNQIGTQLLALRSKWAPALYNLNEPKPIIQFDHEDYLNSCTLKSCTFAGDRDQYVCSGSDDFCVYVWKILQNEKPTYTSNKLHLKLKGHRSIVNQVRYHSKFHLLISSGVEKIIKVWTPFKLENSVGGLLGHREEYLPSRKMYTNRELFERRWFPQSTLTSADALNLYQSVEEDETMIAFFDSLVRKEINSWSSEDLMDNDDNRNSKTSSSSSSETSDTSIIETDSENDDENKKTKVNRPNLISFLSDNENEQNSSSSSSSSNISINSTQRKSSSKVRISLRDRLRNLRHRKSLNLTENSDYINVLESLNVPHGSDSRSSSRSSERVTKIKQQACNSTQLEAKQQFKTVNFEEHKKNVNTIKNLNKQRRKIELEEEEEDNGFDNDQPSTSSSSITKFNETKFKKSRKMCENDNESRNYRLSKSNNDGDDESEIKTKQKNLKKK